MYLVDAGRVMEHGEGEPFGAPPPGDVEARRRAQSERRAKLKSPLAHVSPVRLLVRGLAKDVDDAALRAAALRAARIYIYTYAQLRIPRRSDIAPCRSNEAEHGGLVLCSRPAVAETA